MNLCVSRQLSPQHKHYEPSTLCMNKRKLFILDIITLNHLQELSSKKINIQNTTTIKKTSLIRHSTTIREREREISGNQIPSMVLQYISPAMEC